MIAARSKGEVQVDGAILATPDTTHVPLGLTLVQAGINGYATQPRRTTIIDSRTLSTTLESGRSLVSEADKLGVKILTGHHRRFNPIHCRSQRDDRSWTTGERWGVYYCLFYLQSNQRRVVLAVQGSYPILINLIHELDPLLRYFLGDIVHVYCKKAVSTRPFDVEETGAVLLTFGNGAVGTCIFSDAAASPHSWEGASKFLVKYSLQADPLDSRGESKYSAYSMSIFLDIAPL